MTVALEDAPHPEALAWARQYKRHPGKVEAARAWCQREADRLATINPASALGYRRRVNALAVAMREVGRCGDCGRALKTEESRRRGIGPECWTKNGHHL